VKRSRIFVGGSGGDVVISTILSGCSSFGECLDSCSALIDPSRTDLSAGCGGLRAFVGALESAVSWFVALEAAASGGVGFTLSFFPGGLWRIFTFGYSVSFATFWCSFRSTTALRAAALWLVALSTLWVAACLVRGELSAITLNVAFVRTEATLWTFLLWSGGCWCSLARLAWSVLARFAIALFLSPLVAFLAMAVVYWFSKSSSFLTRSSRPVGSFGPGVLFFPGRDTDDTIVLGVE